METSNSFKILDEIIQEEKNDLSNNEIFSYVSLMTLLHIVEIFSTEGNIKPQNDPDKTQKNVYYHCLSPGNFCSYKNFTRPV